MNSMLTNKLKNVTLIIIFFSLSFFCSLFIFLFYTEYGHHIRKIGAEIILSSQHRHWSKYTFLSEKELNDILYKIETPKYVNSHEVEAISKLHTNDNAVFNPILTKKETLKTKELTIKAFTIKESYPDHYFKGKILLISNPSNVKLSVSQGTQVNNQFGEQIHYIAKMNNAISAINASGFLDPNGRGNGGIPIGIVIENKKILNTPGGNNVKTYIAALNEKNDLITGVYSANDLVKLKTVSAAGFKPQLIVKGKKMIKEGNGGWGYGPRTAIGQTKDGTILFLVIDGRQPHSIGASIKDIQNILYDYGAVNAMAMDGGSSSVMYFNGKNITTPSSVNNIPRYIPNAWTVIPHHGQRVNLYNDGQLINTYIFTENKK